MRGSRDGKESPYAPLLASSTVTVAGLHRIGGSVMIFIFQDLNYAPVSYYLVLVTGVLASAVGIARAAKVWMICSLTGAVSSEIVSKVRKFVTSSMDLSVMAKACLTAKLTNCAGMVLPKKEAICALKILVFWTVGHIEPGVIFRRFPLIIGEGC